MPMTLWTTILGVAVLASAWAGPLPAMSAHAFTAHMSLHMLVVAVAAPLLALGLLEARGGRSRALVLLSPLTASFVELVVVWSWHTPFLHQAARTHLLPFIAEQASFLVAALLLWLSVLGAMHAERGRHAGTALLALLLTLAHMTLLGALLSLSPRPLYPHGSGLGVDAIADQQLGGTIMIVVSGIVYLTAGLIVGYRLAGTDRLRRA